MELDIIKLQTTWNDAAGSINSNYAKIADAIAQLKANGGGGGGGADIDLTAYATKVWVEAKGYITASALTPYALKTDIPSLVGYATEDFVNSKLGDYATKDYVTTKLVDYAPLTSVQGFENRIGGLEGAVPQLNERVSIVEGEVSSLNETVSTGENNLLDRVNTIETDYVTSGNLESAINGIDLSAYLLKADLTKSRIQSTLGISDWALAATKPSYAWSEITSRPTALSQFTDDVVAGKFLPLSEFQVAAVPNPSTVYLQSGIYRQNDGPHLAVGTSGWSQFITLHAEGDNWAQMYFSYDGRLHYRTATFGDGDPANIPWTAIITEKNIGNYNAGSATKLKTRCKLWGNDFEGTADVSGNLFSDIWRIIKASNWDGTFIQSANYDGTSDLGNIYMTAMHGNKLISFNVWANNSKFSDNVTVDGNVGIGNESPTEKLDVNGNVKASGNINATSITINGVTITASNGSITVNGNVLATGDITGGV